MSDLAELRRQIEDLALRAVISEADAPPLEADSSWRQEIARISQAARQCGAARISAAADTVAEAIGASGTGNLNEGIARLQEALQAEASAQPDPVPPAQDCELLSDFILESREHLANIENHALELERVDGSSESLNAVFRGFHTIKGLAGFLELWEVQALAHEVETVLDRARNGELTIDSAAVDVILQSADSLRGWLTYLEGTLKGERQAPPALNEPLLARIRSLSAKQEGSEPPGDADVAPPAPASGTETASEPVAPGRQAEAAPPAAARREVAAVRVETAKLDYLVDMAGEMVIAESLVRHDPGVAALKSPKFQRKMAQLTRITAELQKTAMALRLVPIGPLFRRMARLVRDLSRQFGKNVVFETEGEEIELDRNIVEELADPLMHMVRNALDHGIESPEQRELAGKTPAARVILRGRHHAGQVLIEISDDGRGLDRSKILARAIQKGLIASGEGMSDNDIYNLIFQPGFTTAAQVTNVSGRGVGMDVVRRHIEKLRGRVEIRTVPGQGSTFALKLPLTLAIIDGLVVGVGQERYIAPLFAVREILRPKADTLWTVRGRAEMALIRGELLPVLRLYRIFNVKPRSEDPLESALVVAEVEGRRFCLVVDELLGKQEVVIKSLGETFKEASGVAGGAILGDGRVGLILDLERLFKDRADDSGR